MELFIFVTVLWERAPGALVHGVCCLCTIPWKWCALGALRQGVGDVHALFTNVTVKAHAWLRPLLQGPCNKVTRSSL